MEKSFIPHVGVMIKKEKEHLNHLKYKKEMAKNNRFLFIFRRPMHSTISIIDDFIKNTEESIKHLEIRHKEYIEYVNELKKE